MIKEIPAIAGTRDHTNIRSIIRSLREGYLQHHGRPWSTHGRPWVDHGGTMFDHGRPWSNSVGRRWKSEKLYYSYERQLSALATKTSFSISYMGQSPGHAPATISSFPVGQIDQTNDWSRTRKCNFCTTYLMGIRIQRETSRGIFALGARRGQRPGGPIEGERERERETFTLLCSTDIFESSAMLQVYLNRHCFVFWILLLRSGLRLPWKCLCWVHAIQCWQKKMSLKART